LTSSGLSIDIDKRDQASNSQFETCENRVIRRLACDGDTKMNYLFAAGKLSASSSFFPACFVLLLTT
jgi:hypothetical protein